MDAATLSHIQSSLSAVPAGLRLILPELLLSGTVLVLVAGAAFSRQGHWLPWASLLGLTLASAALIALPGQLGLAWGGMLISDQLGRWARGLLLFVGFVTVLWTAREPLSAFRPEFHSLLMGLLLGTMFMTLSANLLIMYLSLELVSICAYLLTAHRRQVRAAAEAAMKYIIFGAFSSGLMLYGISWFYGLTGSLSLGEATNIAQLNLQPGPTQLMVMGLIFAGLLFKIAAVPLHFWAPDIYQGTSFPVATFFSIVPKAGGLLMLAHLLALTHELSSFAEVQVILLLVAVASMTLGNLAALWQTDLKRLLAYSSIAQSGFMLLAVACRSNTGEAATLFYLTIYLLMNLNVFIIAAGLGRSVESDDLRQLDGLAFRYPISTVAITIGLVALVGLPPTSGFIAKWYVLMAGIEQVSETYSALWVITLVLAVINTVISLFYYLRIPARMVLHPPSQATAPHPLPPWIWLGIVMAAPTLLLGFMGFDELMNWIQTGLWNLGP